MMQSMTPELGKQILPPLTGGNIQASIDDKRGIIFTEKGGSTSPERDYHSKSNGQLNVKQTMNKLKMHMHY